MDKKEFQKRAVDALLRANVHVDERGLCQQCGNNDFLVSDRVIFPPVMTFGEEEIEEDSDDAPALPCVGVICKRCGHVRMFAAGYLGILAPEAQHGQN